ncbi:MAG: hypothetical protein M3Y08_14685 [Fibrobacterota bacterium]|nr:hypothetical protein [Fibrobacterota bacterium]
MNSLKAYAGIACLAFTGCYTQLYTQGYGQRAAAYPEYDRGPQTQAQADPADGEYDSSALAGTAREADTLYRSAPPVIVNNYYNESPYYRGYRIDDWNYPYISLGFYSSGYRSYYDPYWWNDSRYHRHDRRYHGGYDRNYGGGSDNPPSGGGSSGSYQSDKRIFTPAPDRSVPKKGRRSESGASNPNPAPAPKVSEEGSGSSSPSSSEGPSTQSGGESSTSGSSDKAEHKPLKKGKRR